MIINISPPSKKAQETPRGWDRFPVLSYGFRPFYWGAAIFAIVALSMWTSGFDGVRGMRDFYWHAHEMLYGYAAAVIAGFLLTAVVNWTGLPSAKNQSLLFLVILWLLARIVLYFPYYGLTASFLISMMFYIGVCFYFAKPIVKSKNKRNYLPIVVIAVFGLSHAGFDLSLINRHTALAQSFMYASLTLIVGIMSLIGMRVLPFFTARRLGTVQRNMPLPLHIAGVLSAVVCAICLLFDFYELPALLSLFIMGNLLFMLKRIYHRGIWQEPMLWILHVALFFVAIGTPTLMIGLCVESYQHLAISWYDVGVHFITIGGIGALTLGMMSRTTLGHTGRQMRAVQPMPWAFRLMFLGALFRMLFPFAVTTFWQAMWWHLSATCFILALALFLYRYTPWLWQRSL